MKRLHANPDRMTGDDVVAPASACSPDHGCSLCGDVAVRARVASVDAAAGSARAIWDGGSMDVALDLVDGIAVGDVILVHQGFAIGRLDE